MQIDKKLYDEINEFCKENDLKTRDFIHKILKEGFLKEKYGDSPFKTPIKEIVETIVSSPPEIDENLQKQIIDLYDEVVEKEEIKTPATPEEAIHIATAVMDRIISTELLSESPAIEHSVQEKPKVKKKRKLN